MTICVKHLAGRFLQRPKIWSFCKAKYDIYLWSTIFRWNATKPEPKDWGIFCCGLAIFLKFLPFLSPLYSIFSLLKANILQCNIYPKTIYYMEMGNVYYCGMRMSSTTYFLCMNVLQIYFMEIGNVYYCRMSSTTYFLCIETSNFATRGRLRSLLRKQSPYGAWRRKKEFELSGNYWAK